MDGDLARYSPILKERFPSGFFILSDTLNLTANLLIFIWSALYIAAMWLDGIISPTPLVVLSVAGISVSLQAIPMNRKIKTELYDSVTKFKHISELPDDVRESYGNASNNSDNSFILPVIILVYLLLWR